MQSLSAHLPKTDAGLRTCLPRIEAVLFSAFLFMHEFTVLQKDSGQRLDKFVSRLLFLAPRSFLYKAFRNKDIRLNGAKAAGSELLRAGDKVQLRFCDAQYESLGGENPAQEEKETEKSEKVGKIEKKAVSFPASYGRILYEDENLIIADKKSGVLSQKAKPEDRSINEVLLDYCGGRTPLFTPSVCNRLDRNTSGILLFARTYQGAREAAGLLKERQARKFYLAAVSGRVTEGGRMKARLVKKEKENLVTILAEGSGEGALIETAWEPVAYGRVDGACVTLLKVELLTGKTHQIRAQLAACGHPVLGDVKYGGIAGGEKFPDTGKKKKTAVRRLMLHSYELFLPGRGTFRAEPPKEFLEMFPGAEENLKQIN